jgi:hypothetical protein
VVRDVDDIPIKPSKAMVREEKPAEEEEEEEVAPPKYDFEAMLEQALQKENPGGQVKKGPKKEAPKKSKTARGQEPNNNSFSDPEEEIKKKKIADNLKKR